MQKLPVRLLSLVFACMPMLGHAAPQTVVLNVPTMDCATCPLTIKAALLKVPGVSSAKVSYKKREAVVEYDDARTDVQALKKATSDAGYPALLKD
ncbi:MAG TPA: mercury resistance system periplasmic binding protein MerP [Rhodocyclaceae bacterium]|nr:mercury resistance system periplasmic binding protein MerP [Rhodocyclaceae bacterium]